MIYKCHYKMIDDDLERVWDTRSREGRAIVKNVEQKCNVNIYEFTSSFSQVWGLLVQECVYPDVNWTR